MSKKALSPEEKAIEKSLVRGEYKAVSKSEYESVVQAIMQRKRDAVLNIRVNGEDLKRIKEKAKRLGVGYQTFLSELIHHFAV